LVVGSNLTATSFSAVSGTATFGGPATLTATLTTTTGGTPISGATVTFSLNGTSVGTATTNSSGVATLSGVANSEPAGTNSAVVGVSFAGNSTDAASSASGNLVVSQSATTLGSVAGTAPAGGPATLTAKLTSSTTNKGASGATISFTLDGVSVGTAVTDSNGVATLTGVPTSDPSGTHTGVVQASFAGNTNYTAAASATGDLVVGTVATTLSNVAGTAQFGGKATLVATLAETGNSVGIAGQTVSFTLDGTSVGTAVTNSLGIATLSDVTTTHGVGTDTGGVVASYAGSGNFAAATNATGDLVVSKADTALSAVSGTAAFGGTATLKAMLMSNATNQPIAGETVDFTLDGTSVGTAVTDSSGVATLTGVATTHNAGTDTGGIVASYAGSGNFNAATNVTGDLVVSPAATTLTSVSGTATGGEATLAATLMSSVTNQGISGQTVDFTLDGTDVGTATTNSSGVATLSNVATSDPTGTHTGAVVAKFTATTNLLASTGTGDLVVS
jgi:hypothetical protein